MAHDTNLEVHIVSKLTAIKDGLSSRNHKELKEKCSKLLGVFAAALFGQEGSKLSVPFSPDVADELLEVLRGAFAVGSPKLSEPALSCLHKLVAYAYIQGETSPSGRLDDTSNIVTQVVGLTTKCGESSSTSIQLQVIKALLTYVTAEHFLAHGDCLMQAVRTVFNLAIGAESPDMQNTAKSALLQMVNTVLKRVGQQIMTPAGTPQPSPLTLLTAAWQASSRNSSHEVLPTVPEGGSVGASAQTSAPASTAGDAAAAEEEGRGRAGQATSATATASASEDGSSPQQQQEHVQTAEQHGKEQLTALDTVLRQQQGEGEATDTSDGGEAEDVGSPKEAVAEMVEQTMSASLDALHLTPPFHSPAAAAEAAGPPAAAEAAAVGAAPLSLPPINTGSPQGAARLGGLSETEEAAAAESALDDDARTAQLASLAEQADLRGLERALDALPQSAEGGSGAPSRASDAARLARQDTPPDPRRALMRNRRARAWKLLTVCERDAVVVLSAMCKMAARDSGSGAVESYMQAGKLLALDLLVRVLTNPMHDWGNAMRPEFAAELRQPLCLLLVRNCMSPHDQAVTAAVRIFSAILSAQRLRAGLKAELGALYPLLLLKPIEADTPESQHGVAMAAEGLLAVCSAPQTLVDLFVNYDCALQAANLFERTIKALTRLISMPDINPHFSQVETQRLKATALRALLAAVKSLDTWAGPIKSVAALSDGAGLAEASSAEEAGSGLPGIGPVGSPAAGPVPMWEELERIQADREMKVGLQAGIEAFNNNGAKGARLLAQSGVVPGGGSPQALAQFLRDHAAELDKTQIGELFGHHDDSSIAIMHAFIDGEQYAGMSLDAALRHLLAQFRLPGEAQKIDRIMEKFAERYCADNPTAFATADGAYLLAFACIMLNTDAHNPSAERRISPDDFVAMAMYQTEAGEFEPILPAEDVLALYNRIVQQEIQVPDGPGSQQAGTANGRPAGIASSSKADSSRRARLASAVGLTQMVLPFWSGATWDKQHGVDVERKRLMAVTQELVAAGQTGSAGSLWHNATHAEHARPMLQVSGNSVLRGLRIALDAAPSVQAALYVLEGYEQAVRLAALLQLEPLCEALLSALAAAAGVEAPAPPQSAAEAKQAAVLSKLMALGSCSEAACLGSGWLILLRTLSQLERLQAKVMPGSQHGALPGGPPPPMPAAPSPPPSSGFGRLLAKMGLGSSGGSDAAAQAAAIASPRRQGSSALTILDAPGAGLALWAETAGAGPIERVFSGSTALGGDAVLSFMRALCAVSQEELNPTAPGERPVVYLLQKVVECAHHNMGRIRLVWSRLWNIVAQHLVSAACHTDPDVAMYAVDALRQLAAKLLDRAELARFTTQGEALRPFAAVLRHSDSARVRELAVACVSHASSSHARGLGSGWRSVLEALGVAAGDEEASVVAQALDALQPVIEALLHPGGPEVGHTCLRECAAAALAAARNKACRREDLCLAGVFLLQTLARRLAEAVAEAEPEPRQHEHLLQTLRMPLASAASGHHAASWTPGTERAGEQAAAEAGLDPILGAWEVVLLPLASLARHDSQPQVADTAATVLLQCLRAYGGGFTAQQWRCLYHSTLLPVLALPDAAGAAAASDANGLQLAGRSESSSSGFRVTPAGIDALPASVGEQLSPEGIDRVERHASAHMPDVWALLAEHPTAGDVLLGPVLALLAAWVHYPAESAAVLGVNQLHQLLQQQAAAGRLGASSARQEVVACLRELCLEDPVAPDSLYLPSPGPEAAARLGRTDSNASTGPWPTPGAAEAALAAAAAAAAEGVRRRCRVAVLLQRVLDALLRQQAAALPGGLQLDVLDLLLRMVEGAASVDGDLSRQAALARLLGAAEQQQEQQAASAEVIRRTLSGAALANGRAAQQAHSPAAKPSPEVAAAAAAAAAVGSQRRASSQTDSKAPDDQQQSDAAVVAAALPPSLPDTPAIVAGRGGSTSSPGEVLLPALVRQEAEGGCLYLASLQRCCQAPSASDGSVSELQRECFSRLTDYCLRVVAAAAQRVAGPSLGGTGSSAGAKLARAVVPGPAAAAPLPPQPAAPSAAAAAAEQPWADAVLAPLVEAALLALADMPSAAWRQQQATAFLHMSALICSPSRRVRLAAAKVMRVVYQPQLDALPTANALSAERTAGSGGASGGSGS